MKRHEKGILSGIVKTVSVLTLVTIASKMLGLLREVGIASSFDNITTDALYVALIIPAILFTSIGVAIQNLFMIEFTAVKNESEDKAPQSHMASNISNILLVFASIIFVISFLFTPVIIKLIAPGFTDPAKFDLTVKLTRILLPTMIILPVYQIRASMLRVYNKFVTVAIIDLGFNIFQIVYLLLFADKFGIEGLTFSILFAYIFQLILIELVAFRLGFRIKAVFDFNDKHWKTILKLFLPTFVSFGVIQLNASIDKVIASSLADGAISALNYGYMIRTVLYSVVISTILLVVYPVLLKHKNNNDKDSYNKVGVNTFKILWVLSLPITLLLMVFNESIVRIIFERGEFTAGATQMTSQVLFFYAIGITFYAIKEFLVLISFTQKNTKMPLVLTIIGAILNVGFSLLFKLFLGVNGIALGLALSEVISAIFVMIYVQRKGYLSLKDSIRDLSIVLILNIAIGVILYFIYPYLVLPTTKVLELVAIGIYSVIILIVYVIILHITKVSLVKDFISTIRSEEDA